MNRCKPELLIIILLVLLCSTNCHYRAPLNFINSGTELTEIRGEVKTMSQLDNTEDEKSSQYTANNDITFSKAGFSYVRRTTHPYTGVVSISNTSMETTFTIKHLSIFASSRYSINVTDNTPEIANGKRRKEEGPLTVETDAVGKSLRPSSDMKQQMAEVMEKIQASKQQADTHSDKLTPEQSEEEERLAASHSTVKITLDLSAFPELNEIDGKLEIALELILEDENGKKSMAKETFSLVRAQTLPHRQINEN